MFSYRLPLFSLWLQSDDAVYPFRSSRCSDIIFLNNTERRECVKKTGNGNGIINMEFRSPQIETNYTRERAAPSVPWAIDINDSNAGFVIEVRFL